MEEHMKLAQSNLLKTLLLHVNSERCADVYFIVGKEEERFAAHTSILTMRSPVFRKMLTGQMAESSITKKKEGIHLLDFSPKIFKQLLKFIYSADILEELHPSTVLDLLECANFFQVEDLKAICSRYAQTEALSLQSVLYILKSAYLHEADSLVNSCLAFIDQNAKQVLASTQIETLPNDVLKLILKRDSLEVEELNVFHSVTRWIYKNDKKFQKISKTHHQIEANYVPNANFTSESATNGIPKRDKHISRASRELLSHISFQDMTVKDIISVVEPSGVLSVKSLLDIYRSVAAREANVNLLQIAQDKDTYYEKQKQKEKESEDFNNKVLSNVWWRTKSRCGPITSIKFSTKKNKRGKGLFYYLGTKAGTRQYRNPHRSRLVTVTCSSLQTGYLERIVDIVNSPFSTYNCLNSWIVVTLASRHLFRVTHYSMSRYKGALSPRSWKLQGSIDGEDWITLDEQVDNDALDIIDEHDLDMGAGSSGESDMVVDHTIGHGIQQSFSDDDVDVVLSGKKGRKGLNLHPFKGVAFPLSGESQQGWYSSFRLLQTDRNTGGNYKLCICCFELYGMLRGNEHSPTKRAIVY